MSRTKLGKNIKAFRVKRKLSQDKLARKSDIPFSTLVKIEAGYTPNPSIDTVAKIAKALGAKIDDLMK
jgi:transcriptional regulator with XRE-family HTH domain